MSNNETLRNPKPSKALPAVAINYRTNLSKVITLYSIIHSIKESDAVKLKT